MSDNTDFEEAPSNTVLEVINDITYEINPDTNDVLELFDTVTGEEFGTQEWTSCRAELGGEERAYALSGALIAKDATGKIIGACLLNPRGRDGNQEACITGSYILPKYRGVIEQDLFRLGVQHLENEIDGSNGCYYGPVGIDATGTHQIEAAQSLYMLLGDDTVTTLGESFVVGNTELAYHTPVVDPSPLSQESMTPLQEEEAQRFLLANPRDLPKLLQGEDVDALLENRAIRSFLSYYQLILPKGAQEKLNSVYHKQVEYSKRHPELEHFESLSHLTEEQRNYVMKNLGALQLTYGCGGACKGCGVDAVIGAKEHIPFSLVETILYTYGEQYFNANRTFFYWASDPLEYKSSNEKGGYDYIDVLKLVKETSRYEPYTSTVIPKGTEHVAERMSGIDRLSLSPANENRLRKRGLIELPQVEQKTPVPWGNISARNEESDNTDTVYNTETGIGCFDGALLTPRGLYAIAQSPGINPASPQKQFVIPYLGPSEDKIKVGDDMRTVLAHNMPVFNDQHKKNRVSIKTGTKETTYFFYTEHPETKEMQFVVYAGEKVIFSQVVTDEPITLHFDNAQTTIKNPKNIEESTKYLHFWLGGFNNL